MGGDSVTKPDPSVLRCTSNRIRPTILRKPNAEVLPYIWSNNRTLEKKGQRSLQLTDLQTDDSGLENGALFQQDGFVKIALINKPHVRGSGATGAVGTVTVTTT